MKNTKITCKQILKPLAFASLLISFSSAAHLPSYEGERVRNSGHFEKGGFSQPVRGECDISAVGPTDPDAGSANIYLGVGNTPPNFFCAFTTQDDWSFEYPVDIIERSRTPTPDYAETLVPGFDPTTLDANSPFLEEGYIACSPFNPNPFQCPRQMTNPMTGEVMNLPGLCIDRAKPDDPLLWQERDEADEKGEEFVAEPDGVYHCALLSGTPRPRTSSVLMSTITGIDDVDWGIYRYKSGYGEQPIVAAPQVPACRENMTQFVSFAYAGPMHLKDARTGELLFSPLETYSHLPDEIIDNFANMPDGYGLRVTRPDRFNPSKDNQRIGYASGYAQNAWLLAPHSVKECIDSFEKCLDPQFPELNEHYKGNDIFFINEDEDINLYLMWWIDSKTKSPWQRYTQKKTLYDVSITTGVIDQFLLGDFISISTTGPFTANGRYIHGQCSDPRPGGRVEMTIETN